MLLLVAEFPSFNVYKIDVVLLFDLIITLLIVTCRCQVTVSHNQLLNQPETTNHSINRFTNMDLLRRRSVQLAVYCKA